MKKNLIENNTNSLRQLKSDIIDEIELRREKKILEPENAKLLTKLIQNADTKTEAWKIMALGTTAKRTGLAFDKRLGLNAKFLRLRRDEDDNIYTRKAQRIMKGVFF